MGDRLLTIRLSGLVNTRRAAKGNRAGLSAHRIFLFGLLGR